ncbi:hypothetical protein TRVL_04826 [Trypanosoma vivax]|nr:hypothetical protein TRVL_04826 [Trypanosoma vivax]
MTLLRGEINTGPLRSHCSGTRDARTYSQVEPSKPSEEMAHLPSQLNIQFQQKQRQRTGHPSVPQTQIPERPIQVCSPFTQTRLRVSESPGLPIMVWAPKWPPHRFPGQLPFLCLRGPSNNFYWSPPSKFLQRTRRGAPTIHTFPPFLFPYHSVARVK